MLVTYGPSVWGDGKSASHGILEELQKCAPNTYSCFRSQLLSHTYMYTWRATGSRGSFQFGRRSPVYINVWLGNETFFFAIAMNVIPRRSRVSESMERKRDKRCI